MEAASRKQQEYRWDLGKLTLTLGGSLSFWACFWIGYSPGAEQLVAYFSLPYPPQFETSFMHRDMLAVFCFPKPGQWRCFSQELQGSCHVSPVWPPPSLLLTRVQGRKVWQIVVHLKVPKFFYSLLFLDWFPLLLFSIVLHFARFLPRGNFYSSILKPLQLRIYPGNDTIQLE